MCFIKKSCIERQIEESMVNEVNKGVGFRRVLSRGVRLRGVWSEDLTFFICLSCI